MMNVQRSRFVEAYLKTGNATEAAKVAGYSAKTAYAQGSRLLKDVEVARAVATARGETMKALRVDAATVLGELLHVGTVDPLDLVDEDGKMRPLKDIPPAARRAISSVELEAETETHGRLTKVRFWNKTDALDKLAKHLGLYLEDNVQKAQSFADLVLAAQRRRESRKER